MVWTLATDCDQDLTLHPDLGYFQEHFVGRSMRAGWSPPTAAVVDASKRVRDFVSWMLSAPVISEKAKVCLEPLIVEHAEILPLMELRGQMYYAVNVVTLADCLDRSRSRVVYSADEPDRILNVHAFVFDQARLPRAPIFKLRDYPVDVFVTEAFIAAVKECGLRGAAFGDPGENPMKLILKGKSRNVISGLPS